MSQFFELNTNIQKASARIGVHPDLKKQNVGGVATLIKNVDMV